MTYGQVATWLGSPRAARAVGYQFAASSVGAIVLPAAVGVLADHHGIDVMAPVAFFATVALTLLWATIRGLTRPQSIGVVSAPA